MKKILYLMLALTMATFTFTSCEDVPAPYEDPNDNPIDEPTVIEPEGDGTQVSPYNVAAILQVAGALGEGEVSNEEMYIKGIVTAIDEYYGTEYGNATYTISDDEDGTNKFIIYQSYYFNNERYESGVNIEYGDTVVVYGKVTKFVYESGDTPTLETEARQSYLISINGYTGEGGGGDEPTPGFEPEGDGTEANPFNAVAAYQYAAALSDGEEAGPVYIKGIVSKIRNNYDSNYKTADYYISADGTFDSPDSGNQFYVYASKYLNNEKYSSGDLLSVGDEVVVYGKVMNYKGNTPETVMNESYLYSWKKGEGGDQPGGGEISGNSITATASSFGLENNTALETLTLSDGTTLTFAQNDGYNEPKFYSAGSGSFRMYPSNSVTISSTKTIVGIVVKCDEYQGVTYNASGDLSATSGKINVSGAEVTVSGASTNSLTINNTSTTTGAPSQFRIVEITVYYAE